MRQYSYMVPSDGGSVEVTLCEEEIVKQYWDNWCLKMIKRGENIATLSEKDCILDWCTIHWAWEVERKVL